LTITIPSVSTSATPPQSQAEFEAVFHEYWPRIYQVLYRLTGDPEEAQDLALEVFYRMHQRPPARWDPLTLGGWLYRVATNLGYNALRSWKRRAQYERQAGTQALEDQANPAEQAEQRIERRRVRQVLARMKPRSAELLVLRYSGVSYDEIAAALAVAPGSVGTLLARAEREFEQLYAADGG